MPIKLIICFLKNIIKSGLLEQAFLLVEEYSGDDSIISMYGHLSEAYRYAQITLWEFELEQRELDKKEKEENENHEYELEGL